MSEEDKKWRKDFENTFLGLDFTLWKDKLGIHPYIREQTNEAWNIYREGRKKAQEEFEIRFKNFNEGAKLAGDHLKALIEEIKIERDQFKMEGSYRYDEIQKLKEEIEEYRLNAIGKMNLEIAHENSELAEKLQSRDAEISFLNEGIDAYVSDLNKRDKLLERANELMLTGDSDRVIKVRYWQKDYEEMKK